MLIKAGMPIMQMLDAMLERHDRGNLSEILRQVREDVKGGAALSSALEKHGRFLPHLYIASIRAGERTGDLPNTIRRYIQYLKRVDGIRKKIIAALYLPGNSGHCLHSWLSRCCCCTSSPHSARCMPMPVHSCRLPTLILMHLPLF